MIQLSELTKIFGDRVLFDHVTWQITARERVAAHVLVQRLSLAPVARGLGTRHALLQDRLALTPFHDASLPAAR